MSNKNLMNSLAAQVENNRSGASSQGNPMYAPVMNISAITKAIGGATDGSDRRLGPISRWQARRHAATEVLETNKHMTVQREQAIRELVKESIHAETKLIRASLKLRFDSKFGVLAQQGLASYATVQRDLHAVVDAGSDIIHHDLYERMQMLSAKHAAGELSDHHFNAQVQRAWAQAERATQDLEASCGRKLDAIKQTFEAAAQERN